MLTALIAGCNSGGSDGEDDNPFGGSEFIYVPEYISLPEDLTDISNLVIAGERLVFSSSSYDAELGTQITNLYSMGLDGSELSQMENYVPEQKPEDAPDNTVSNVFVAGIFPDGEGNIWVNERCSFFYYDIPEGVSDEELEMFGPYPYYQPLREYTVMRQLDFTGAEQKRIDLSILAEDMEYYYINATSIDGDGNLYVGIDRTIYVVKDNGEIVFQIDTDNWINQLIALPDGSVAHFEWGAEGQVLKKIDIGSKRWGEEISLPNNAYNLFSGGGDYDMIFSDSSNLYGFDLETGEQSAILNWINSDISSDNMGAIAMLPDESILYTNMIYDYSNEGFRMRYEIGLLSKVPADSVPPRTVLTLACYGVDYTLRNTIVNFNKTNTKYRIYINDYSEFNTTDDYTAGRTKLSTEIISGNVPDMILTTGLPFNQYIARGLIEDLYPYIDADPELNRDALMESALRACEVDGGLYQLFQTFFIYTIWGNAAVLGGDGGWNMEEFTAVIDSNPQAPYPLGYYIAKNDFLLQTVVINLNQYIDWTKGEAYFDSEDFVKLLEFANTLPERIEYDWENYVSEESLILSGEQIMRMGIVYDLQNPLMEMIRFEGDLVYKGFPSENRAGNNIYIQGSMAMTTACKDKDGAWEFMREILGENSSSGSFMTMGFPINKAGFNKMLDDMMNQEYITDEDGNEVPVPKYGFFPQSGGYRTYSAESFGMSYSVYSSAVAVASVAPRYGGSMGEEEEEIYIYAMTQEQADQIMKLFDSVSGVMGGYDESLYSIITEGAENYFNGRGTAEEAARVIQSRASIYISEQS